MSLKQNRGFTLLEMLVVIALISICAALVGGRLSRSLHVVAEREVVAQIVKTLRAARSAAIFSGVAREARFDLVRRTFQVSGQRVRRWPGHLIVQINTAVNLDSAFIFHPDGSSSGGNIVVFSGQHEWRIDVGWLTGDVESRVLK